uniref:Uncharacterized protein n=1 Tax=Kalanchoe fedtschenkoi TaxID=63787 RepID=A0A7N0ZQU6_KALFE
MAQRLKFVGALRSKHLFPASSPTFSIMSHQFYGNSSEAHQSRQFLNNEMKLRAPGVMGCSSKSSFTGNSCLYSSLMTCRSLYAQAAASSDNPSSKVYAPYTVFKGKAALSVSPVLPTFRKLDSGGLQLDRRGVMMLNIWPAIGERKYDWEKRQSFALSATEVGSLLTLGPQDSCEFFHDPSMKTSNAGQVRKSLSIKANADNSGYFFSLSVANNILKTSERLTVPVTSAEFAVMRTAFSFALPHIMGWDRIACQLSAGVSYSTKAAPLVKDMEWDR